MSSNEAEDKKNPVRKVLGENVKRIRGIRGMTVRDLSARLKELGLPLSPSGVSEIENATRKVGVEELVTIAVAMNTSLVDLLLPPRGKVLKLVDGVGPIASEDMYWWLRGEASWPAGATMDEFIEAASDMNQAVLLRLKDPVIHAISSLETIAMLAQGQQRPRIFTSLATAARQALDNVNREFGALIKRLEERESNAW